MFQIFDDFDLLMEQVHRDRHIDGDGASLANRFPIRFILFDNFTDCCRFMDDLVHLPNCQIQRVEYWMDDEYPDTFLTHNRLAEKIRKMILERPTEYRILMPFSELARFYDNTPEKTEFNALITTLKGFDTNKYGFEFKQRVYIPIVGLEGKMQHLREDVQSFVWYYRNPDRQQDYRLILSQSTYGVENLSHKYHVVDNLKSWLGCWQYPHLKDNIISISKAIFSHANYAQPDNAFQYCVCNNAYDFLVKGLKLDLGFCEYKEEEKQFWEQLAAKVDIKNFKLETFFKNEFQIYDLSSNEVFFKLWFENKQPFMRWLLAKYYIHRFCNMGYVCNVLQSIDYYNDASFMRALALNIFSYEDSLQYTEERMVGLSKAAEYHIELAPEVQAYVVEKIKEVAEKEGVLSALHYLSSHSKDEKCLIVDWYNQGKIDDATLQQLYPDLYYYLQPTVASTPESWVLDYIYEYKKAKMMNQYTPAIKQMIEEKNANEIEYRKWADKFSTTKTLLYNRQDIDCYCWIDGLGIDWIPFITQVVKEHELDGYYLNEVMVATAKVPTKTDINKTDIEVLSGELLTKIGDLDQVAHMNSEVRKYPRFVIDDLEMVRHAIHKLLIDHPNEKIAIVSDHGMTYLSQLCDGHNLVGYTSDHHGRVAVKKAAIGLIPQDANYYRLEDGKTICALRHESLMKKIPYNTGCHGGCTPEEQLVPIFIISPNPSVKTWSAKQKSFELEEANPIFQIELIGLDDNCIPMIKYDNRFYSLKRKVGSLFESGRMTLVDGCNKVTLYIGSETQEFTITLKMAVVEDDLFDDF